jgi:DNA modification methylase
MFLDNLLYMYTQPWQIVVDPFAGGGSTIDVCKKRLRRYWASDRQPIVERRDIRQWDILAGPPALHKRWGEVAGMEGGVGAEGVRRRT